MVRKTECKRLYPKDYVGPNDTCKVCQKKFHNSMAILRHFREKHLGIKHICSICKLSYSQEMRLQIHVRAVHYGIKHECPVENCSKVHEASTDLKKHLKKKHQITDPDLSKMVKESIAKVKKRYKDEKLKESSKQNNRPKVNDQLDESGIPDVIEKVNDEHANVSLHCEKCGISLASSKLLQMHQVLVHHVSNYNCT